MRVVLFALGGVLLLLTLLALLRSERWWVRFADYPRLQIGISLAVVLMLHATLVGWGTSLELERQLGHKTLEVEIHKEALDKARR